MNVHRAAGKKRLSSIVSAVITAAAVYFIYDNFEALKTKANELTGKPVEKIKNPDDFIHSEAYLEMDEAQKCKYWEERIAKENVLPHDYRVRRDRACKYL